MENLRRGITTKIANAGGVLLHRPSQLFGGDKLSRVGSIFELVILAVQAVEGAGMIEDS